MSKFCTHCGTKNVDQAIVCTHCNNKFHQAAEVDPNQTSVLLVQMQAYLPAILGGLAFILYWFPWVAVKGFGRMNMSGSELAGQVSSSLYLVPIYALIVIAGFFLLRQRLVTSMLYRNVTLGGAGVMVVLFVYLLASGDSRVLSAISFTLWFWLEIVALIATAVSVLKPELLQHKGQ